MTRVAPPVGRPAPSALSARWPCEGASFRIRPRWAGARFYRRGMDRNDHVGSADPGNSDSSDGLGDGFKVRKRLLGESASEVAAVARAVRGVEIGGLMAAVAAALPGSLTAAAAPELVVSCSHGIGVLADGLVEHAGALRGAAAEYRGTDMAAAAVFDASGR